MISSSNNSKDLMFDSNSYINSCSKPKLKNCLSNSSMEEITKKTNKELDSSNLNQIFDYYQDNIKLFSKIDSKTSCIKNSIDSNFVEVSDDTIIDSIKDSKRISFQSLLKLVVQTDFLIQSKKSSKKGISNFTNLYSTIVGFKEMINILEFLSQQKKYQIFFILESRYLKLTAELLFSKLGLNQNKNLQIINSFRTIKKQRKKNVHSLVFTIGTINSRFIKEFFRHDFCFMYVINNMKHQPVSGLYSMYNDLSTIKKMITLFVLINNVLNRSLPISEKTNFLMSNPLPDNKHNKSDLLVIKNALKNFAKIYNEEDLLKQSQKQAIFINA